MNPRRYYREAQKMRLAGQSYGEIKGVFGIPKSTLSNWFSALKIGPRAKKILLSKRKNGYLKLLEFNKKRTEKVKINNENIRKEFESMVGELSDRELIILGAGLYWGEGYKNFGKPDYTCLSFANSDPMMILVFIKFLENYLDVSKDKIKFTVMIHKNLVPEGALRYWLNLTGYPAKNFRVQRLVSPASRNIRPRNILPNGTLQVRISRRQEFFKVKGLIDGIIRALT